MVVRLPSLTWQILKTSWLEFARRERELSGLRPFIPFFQPGTGRPRTRIVNHNCYCRKSSISFPHWPPSSYQEAVQQLLCVLGENIDHRKSLSSSWLSFVNQKAFGVSSESLYSDISRLIKSLCPVLLEEQKKEEREALYRQAAIDYHKAFSCSAFCNPALQERRFDCLCHCKWHRDECPAHANRTKGTIKCCHYPPLNDIFLEIQSVTVLAHRSCVSRPKTAVPREYFCYLLLVKVEIASSSRVSSFSMRDDRSDSPIGMGRALISMPFTVAEAVKPSFLESWIAEGRTRERLVIIDRGLSVQGFALLLLLFLKQYWT
ncbi:hypothetical protein V8E54_008003 [Elaphomyces granulatus]